MALKMNDRVKITNTFSPYVGQTGTVFEMVPKQRLADGSFEDLYSVRLDPWTEEKFLDVNGNEQKRYRHPTTKELRGHPSDCLGCVRESDVTPIK